MSEPRVTCIVLAGGEARRFGGDKLGASYAGSTVLGHLLDGLPSSWQVVCVGPERETHREVSWTREEPPGGGPAAAIGAGFGVVDEGAQVVAIVAGDQPDAANAAARLVEHLRHAPDETEAVAAGYAGGTRMNPLLSAFRPHALRRAVSRDVSGRSAGSLFADLVLEVLDVPERDQHDIDLPDDL